MWYLDAFGVVAASHQEMFSCKFDVFNRFDVYAWSTDLLSIRRAITFVTEYGHVHSTLGTEWVGFELKRENCVNQVHFV